MRKSLYLVRKNMSLVRIWNQQKQRLITSSILSLYAPPGPKEGASPPACGPPRAFGAFGKGKKAAGSQPRASLPPGGATVPPEAGAGGASEAGERSAGAGPRMLAGPLCGPGAASVEAD